MSGIVGIFNRDGHSLDSTHLSNLVERLAHRGPDGTHTWLADAIGLGHCMLWTTPESLIEKLPTQNATGSCVMTADARIDNREALITSLGWQQQNPQTITDSQLILGAYETWGKNCLQHLIGAFAFAIWDHSRQWLFCARDHMGIKPFYYAHSPQRLAFASEIKALLDLPGISRKLNPLRLGDFILLAMHDKVLTTYQDIVRLPPAHSLTVTADSLDIQPYWSLSIACERRLDSDEAYAQEFRHIFTEAVRCRLRSAFPIGAHLSGGLDSSAVVCVARELLQQSSQDSPLHTLSHVFDEVTECDERPFIEAVLEQGDLSPHYIQADQFGPLTDIEAVRQYEDEALLGPSHHYPWRLSQKAQELGLRIVLDGLDGDNVVCHGIPRLRELAEQGDWNAFIQETQGVAKHYENSPKALFKAYGLAAFQNQIASFRWVTALKAAVALHQQLKLSRKALLWQWGIKPWMARYLKVLTRNVLGQKSQASVANTASKVSLLNPDFSAIHNFEARLQSTDIDLHSVSTVREHHWQSLNQGVLPLVLEQFDRTAAAFAIEERHPFMDIRLIEFCLSLPAEQKLNQGWGRIILRRALAGVLPEAIRWRGGKTSMTPNFEYGLLQIDRSVLEALVTHDLEKIKSFVALDTFWQSYEKAMAGKGSERDLMIVWRTVIVANWLSTR